MAVPFGDALGEERESWLLADEEWDDSQVPEASIGRPGIDEAGGG